jgi:hypothetical protein
VEISKRFAAEADAAGLAQTEIAGLASATASLGFAPERGGTALSRVFANMGTNISLANAKGKEFARVTGRSITNLQDSLDKGEGLGIFLDVLKGIKGMSPTDANRTLKALGINNTSDRTIFRAMAENLPFVNEQLEIAANATGSLSEEAQKRFDTIASKITLLKNNIIEAGIAIGTAMLPAIGRATEALSEALKDPATKADLAALGGEIGAAIDDIDWKAVIRDAREFAGVLKSALALVLDILGAVNKLPTEIKAAAAGLLVLNTASGGLIGAGISNVVGALAGSLAKTLAASIPLFGRAFVQPVFVTNMGAGLPGGKGVPGGAAAGAAGLGFGTVVVGAAGAAVIGGAIATAVVTPILDTILPDWRNNPDNFNGNRRPGVDSGGNRRVVPVSVQSVAPGAKFPGKNKDDLVLPGSDIHRKSDLTPTIRDGLTKVDTGINSVKDALKTDLGPTISTGLAEQKAAAIETKRETSRSGGIIAATNRQGSASVVNAIYANRPIVTTIVNVSATTVEKTTIVNKRYGSTGGSRNEDSNGSGTLGNGGR